MLQRYVRGDGLGLADEARGIRSRRVYRPRYLGHDIEQPSRDLVRGAPPRSGEGKGKLRVAPAADLPKYRSGLEPSGASEGTREIMAEKAEHRGALAIGGAPR